MANNYQATITNSADTEITAQTVCSSIAVGEDDLVSGWPTTDWKFRVPAADGTYPAVYQGRAYGTKYTFTRPDKKPYQVGDKICKIALNTGSSTTFSIVELP